MHNYITTVYITTVHLCNLDVQYSTLHRGNVVIYTVMI